MANIATKEQERKALDKIRKIIEELGEDSYIGTAFEGVLEDAEDNIKNDWAMSMKDRWRSAEQTIEQQMATFERLYKEDEAKAEEIKRLQLEKCELVTEINNLRGQLKALKTDHRINSFVRVIELIKFLSTSHCKQDKLSEIKIAIMDGIINNEEALELAIEFG